MSPVRLSRFGRLLAAVGATALLTLLGLTAGAASAAAKKPATGFADHLFQSPDASVREKWLKQSKRAGASWVRLTVSWRAVAPSRPTAPRSPLDPAYNFGGLDATVASARSRGMKVLITVSGAPAWAEGSNRPNSAPAGTWKPSPSAFGDFGHAIAARYSGDAGRPQIQALQAWNEPNLSTYLTPQYKRKRNQSASSYKRMLNRFFSGVKSADRKIRVATAGTAPYGDPPGGDRTRPLTFWRKVFCLKGGQRKLNPSRCKTKPKLDVLAHHPINTSGGPKRSAISLDDASTPDFKQVRRILRAAERGRNVKPGGRHGLWATELWWDSKPPAREGVKLKKQARYYRQALSLLARQGAQLVMGLRVRDSGEPNASRGNASGIFKKSGERKPSYRAWRAGSK